MLNSMVPGEEAYRLGLLNWFVKADPELDAAAAAAKKAQKEAKKAGDEAALLFETHQMLAEDLDYEEAIQALITEDGVNDPEEMMIDREDLTLIEGRIGQMMSGLEREVLVRYMEGKSYVEIADEMHRHVKSIDNALQRIKRKLLKYLEEK